MADAFDLHVVKTELSRAGLYSTFEKLVGTDDLKDQPNDPEVMAATSAMVGFFDSYILVLVKRGWTSLPENPSSKRILLDDLYYRGAWKCESKTVYEHLSRCDIASHPVTGNVFVAHKGGIEELDLSPNPEIKIDPRNLPTAKGLGKRVTFGTILAGAPNLAAAGTFGGMEVSPDGSRIWCAFFESYNTAGRDHLGLVALGSDLNGNDVLGAWRAGPAGTNIPMKDAFHANKTHQWVVRMKSGMGSGRQRAAGAFGGAKGPCLFKWTPDESKPTGSDFGATPYLCYPGGQWSEGYRNAESDDRCNATYIHTKDGREALVFGWTKGLMTATQAASYEGVYEPGHAKGANWYGQSPHKCSQNKGWHANPYEPRLYFYDISEIESATNPWDPQPYLSTSPLELYRHPSATGVDPNCGPPFFGGMTWDPTQERLLVLQAKAFDPSGGSAWRKGCVIHEWRLT